MRKKYYKIRSLTNEYLYKTGDGKFVWIEADRQHKFYEDGFLFTKREVQSIIFEFGNGFEFSIISQ